MPTFRPRDRGQVLCVRVRRPRPVVAGPLVSVLRRGVALLSPARAGHERSRRSRGGARGGAPGVLRFQTLTWCVLRTSPTPQSEGAEEGNGEVIVAPLAVDAQRFPLLALMLLGN